jgi:IclR family KDG regulon transcriptional repressor
MSSQIRSVSRSFQIIEFLSKSPKTQSLKDISAACYLPSSSTHRLLENLCTLGYVMRQSTGFYKLSTRLFEITSRSIEQSSLVSVAKPYLDNLSNRLGETIHLVVRSENDILYIYKVTHPIGPVQMASRIGTRLPMYRCAVGKAILATLNDEEIRQVFDSSIIIATTKNTITSLDDLMSQIHTIRETGYALDNEENEKGIKCVGVSLGRQDDDANYAASVSSLKSRMTEERTQEIAQALLNTKRQIERQLLVVS